MKKLLSLLLIVLLVTSSLPIALADDAYKGEVVEYYGNMCALTSAAEWAEDEFNRTYFSAAAFIDLLKTVNNEYEFNRLFDVIFWAVENDLLAFAYNEASGNSLYALFSGPDEVLMIIYRLTTKDYLHIYTPHDGNPDAALVNTHKSLVNDGFTYYALNCSLFDGCIGVLNEMFPAGGSASTAAEAPSASSVSPAAAEGTTVRVTSDRVSLRNASGSSIATLTRDDSFVITGYDASVGMFTAEYEGTTGYVKGTGLNISKDELIELFQ